MPELGRIVVDRPAANIQRVSLNRPEKRNALDNKTREELFATLQSGDAAPEIRVSIVRGNGPCFSAGYDLRQDPNAGQPYFTAPGDSQWSRHVVQGWFGIWDLAKPVIAQVHGFCLAGGTELATACDLVYAAGDAEIGDPPVRLMSAPDMQYHPWLMGLRGAMEAMLTGDSISGTEAARLGFANRAFPAGELDPRVLEIAARVAKIPPDLQQLPTPCPFIQQRGEIAWPASLPASSRASYPRTSSGRMRSASPSSRRRRSSRATPSWFRARKSTTGSISPRTP
jgi:enoyl-CoA hydratase